VTTIRSPRARLASSGRQEGTLGVLLLGADYYGTLAAARAFGRAGIRAARWPT
jgi:hypothetical protein